MGPYSTVQSYLDAPSLLSNIQEHLHPLTFWMICDRAVLQSMQMQMKKKSLSITSKILMRRRVDHASVLATLIVE